MTGPSIWDELTSELGDPLNAGPTPQAGCLRTHPTESTPQVPSIDQRTAGDQPAPAEDADPTSTSPTSRPSWRERLRAEWDTRSRFEAWFIAVALAVFVIMLLLALLGVFPALVLLS